MIDQPDLQIINALQIHPRASWAQLARILRMDASTISRRWTALTREGDVWTTCFEGGAMSAEQSTSAIVEISCVPGQRGAVIDDLVAQPPIVSVHCTSGARDLYLLISTHSLFALDRYIDERIAIIPGVVGTRTHYLGTIFADGADWRLQALSREQTKAIQMLRPADAPSFRKGIHEQLVTALRTDVRRTAADLHKELGRSVSVISREVDAILVADWVRWRVDVAHSVLGWNAAAVVWLRAPRKELERIGAAMRALPPVRFCASVTGEANLVVFLWLRNLRELDDFEANLNEASPQVQFVDRWIVPRIAKRTGYVLDLDSRATTYVPVSGHPVFDH